MRKIFDSHYNDNLSKILEMKLKQQKLEDLSYVKSKYSEGILDEKLDQLENDYDSNLDKLDLIVELPGRDVEIQRKFVEMILYIDELPINSGSKLDAILTYGSILSKVPTHVELLDNESSYILATSMSFLPLNDYEQYGQVVCNPLLIGNIKKKVTNMTERQNIIYEIFDYLDEVTYIDNSPDDYNLIVNDCLKIISNYKTKHRQK